MFSELDFFKTFLDRTFQLLYENTHDLSIDEALFVPAGGYRSILGTLKHAAAWSHVYRSYAFDPHPVSWAELNWPSSLRDTVIKSKDYLDEIMDWLHLSHRLWQTSLSGLQPNQIIEQRPVHWGDKLPLHEILLTMGNHNTYHAGEINQLLSIVRGEAWEEGEEVEENITSSIGHRVIPPWRRES